MTRGAGVRPLRVLDLFAGAGGFSEGFRAAGYDVVGAVEKDLVAATTLAVNHPETPLIVGEDIRGLDPHDVLELTDGPVDVIIAGPPCQGFSIKGSRDPAHESTDLLFKCVSLIEALGPAAFVVENVPGLISFRKGFVLDRFIRQLNRITVDGKRYSVVFDTLDAACYGVPQHRKRVFMCGILGETFVFPSGSSHRVSLIDAIGDLPEWTTGPTEVVRLPKVYPLTPYQTARRRGATALYNHSAKRLQELRMERLAQLQEGDDRRALPEHLQTGGHEGKYRRLRSSAPAPTLVAHMAKDTSDFIHPRYDRMLTVREAARLQSFDDIYRFTGSQYQQFKQVGNAVAPRVAEALGAALELPARRAARRLYKPSTRAAARRRATA